MTRRTRKNSKKMYKQTGGAFTQEQRNTLINPGNFTEDQINELDEYPVSFENIQSANNLYLDHPHRTVIIVSKYLQDVQRGIRLYAKTLFNKANKVIIKNIIYN